MCKRCEAIQAVSDAADRLTLAAKSHIEAELRIEAPKPDPPMARILRSAFGGGAVTPTDMLHQLGKLK